jgi:hypothetical protein
MDQGLRLDMSHDGTFVAQLGAILMHQNDLASKGDARVASMRRWDKS